MTTLTTGVGCGSELFVAKFKNDSAPPTNGAPVADAGLYQSVNVGATAQPDGSSSSDPDGNSLTFNWSFISKPEGSAGVLSNPTAVNPSFVAGLTGTYVLQLIVNDGSLNGPPDTVTITAIDGSTIGCGAIKSGTIEAAGEVDLYRFSGQAGQIISLALASAGGFANSPSNRSVALSLFAPSGPAVGGVLHSNSQGNFTLPETGVYMIRVNAFNLSATGSYNLRIECR